MKKVKLIISFVCLTGFIALNLSISSDGSSENNLSLDNLKALQVAAGEIYCDLKNDETCTIVVPGATGHSKGYLIATF